MQMALLYKQSGEMGTSVGVRLVGRAASSRPRLLLKRAGRRMTSAVENELKCFVYISLLGEIWQAVPHGRLSKTFC